eukprot:12929650-Alexandrium_andersonii.AAC.1
MLHRCRCTAVGDRSVLSAACTPAAPVQMPSIQVRGSAVRSRPNVVQGLPKRPELRRGGAQRPPFVSY